MTQLSFEEVLMMLDSRTNHERVPASVCTKHFDLVRFRKFLRCAGVKNRLPVILVGGSKGKGSVCALVSEILRQHGKRVGLFLSPHLYDVRERIVLNGEKISEKDFVRYFSLLRDSLNMFSDITYFEILTAIAFAFFSEHAVDFAVLEVGLGGRFDATNVSHPLISVLTPIEKEHTDLLGSSYSDILHHKLGICRDGGHLVIGKQPPRVLRILRDRLRSRSVSIHRSAALHSYRIESMDADGTSFAMMHDHVEFLVKTPLVGVHHVENILTAYSTCRIVLRNDFRFSSFQDACSRIRLSGKTEIRRTRNGRVYVVDVFHTASSAQALRATLDALFPIQRRVFLLSFLRDKHFHAIFRALFRPGDAIIFSSNSSERSAKSDYLYKFFDQKFGSSFFDVSFEDDFEKAYYELFSNKYQAFLSVIGGSHSFLFAGKKFDL